MPDCMNQSGLLRGGEAIEANHSLLAVDRTPQIED